MKIKITLETGNDAMLDGHDVAKALLAAAYEVANAVDSAVKQAGGKILDANGNSVGEWEVRS